ncbi:hypothetical protein DQ04_02721010 [Trypanosoma grayi]|uniref:hypothetical protein n=1 Tax=Trypanosoma grayi TaxID=71804 RepID=UPI0004F3F628|nr:hypothetical protein DQ04_02721010 [Trypanosoma grayi]KEG11342.1 hypothetical protein DQ04_02721010 [Trypanosoma grayi]
MVDRATQTPRSRYGAELRVHFNGLSARMGSLAVSAAMLCILNGCAYYLYWRNVFLFRSTRPAAFYAVAAGVFFLFIMTQLLIQMALRTMIEQISFFERERQVKRCCFIYVLAILPSTAAQMLLYADGWFDVSMPYGAVFVVTAYLNILTGVCALAYIWVSSCVDWVHAGVSRAAREKRAEVRSSWEKQLTCIVGATAPVMPPSLDSTRPAEGRLHVSS